MTSDVHACDADFHFSNHGRRHGTIAFNMSLGLPIRVHVRSCPTTQIMRFAGGPDYFCIHTQDLTSRGAGSVHHRDPNPGVLPWQVQQVSSELLAQWTTTAPI